MEISTGKKLKSRREKIRKSDFAPQENFPVTPLPWTTSVTCHCGLMTLGQSYNLTSDDLWVWYMTFDHRNIQRVLYCFNELSLVPIGLQLFIGHFQSTMCLTTRPENKELEEQPFQGKWYIIHILPGTAQFILCLIFKVSFWRSLIAKNPKQ